MMYSGISGKQFPTHVQNQLNEVMQHEKFESPYWISAESMKYFTPPLELRSKAKGANVRLWLTDSKITVLYNASEISNQSILDAHLGNLA